MGGFGGMIQFWYASFLFCGVFLDPEQVPWPFRAFTYISPHRHATALFLQPDFSETTEWKSAVPCDATALAAGLCDPTGSFYCPNSVVNNFKCYGYTGDQVLKTLSYYYPAIDDTDEYLVGRMLIMVCIAVYFSLVHG